MFELDAQLTLITGDNLRVISRMMEDRLRPFQLTRQKWVSLHYIDQAGVMTQRELANRMSLREPTVVRIVADLEELGLVNRRVSPDDRRVNLLVLTEKGSQLYFRARPIVEQFVKDVSHGISKADVNRVLKTYDRMIANIE